MIHLNLRQSASPAPEMEEPPLEQSTGQGRVQFTGALAEEEISPPSYDQVLEQDVQHVPADQGNTLGRESYGS